MKFAPTNAPINIEATAATLSIDLSALRSNWRLLANKVSYAECSAVIKANAYGVGQKEAMQALLAEGCRTFFVARLTEGRAARVASNDAVIYVLDGTPPDGAAAMKDYDLRPVLNSLEDVYEWAGGGPAALHFDTGMNRLGIAPQDAAQALRMLGAPPALVMSHLSCAEHPDSEENAKQIALFQQIREAAPGVPASLCNSSGVFLNARPWFDMVRPGYALYGGNPTPWTTNPMRPVVSIHAPILQIRRVEPGQRVGYNGVWTAQRPTTVAILAIGYADGLPRSCSRVDGGFGADVAIGGFRCPVIGRISMDLIAADVTDAPEEAARRGAIAEVVGKIITVDEVAERAGTIGYEILTRLGPRYLRVHYDDALRS